MLNFLTGLHGHSEALFLLRTLSITSVSLAVPSARSSQDGDSIASIYDDCIATKKEGCLRIRRSDTRGTDIDFRASDIRSVTLKCLVGRTFGTLSEEIAMQFLFYIKKIHSPY
jgi:hypothetical protein